MTTDALIKKVDTLREMQQKRLAAQKLIDAEYEQEKLLLETIRLEMIASGETEVIGEVGCVTTSERMDPEVEEWEDVWEYMARTGNFQLLQKRLSVTAVREIWEVGDDVPGVVRVTNVYASLKGAPKK